METSDLDSLEKRFAWARKAREYSQVRLAAALGVSQGAIEKLENGKVLKPEYLPEAAKLLKVRYEWLLTGEGQWEDEENEFLSVMGKIDDPELRAELLAHAVRLLQRTD